MSFGQAQEHDAVARQLQTFNDAVETVGAAGPSLFERRRIDSIHSRNSSLCSENAPFFASSPAQPGLTHFADRQPVSIDPHSITRAPSDAGITSPVFANPLWTSNPSLSLDTAAPVGPSSRSSISRYGQYTPPEDGQPKSYAMEHRNSSAAAVAAAAAAPLQSANIFGSHQHAERRLSSVSAMDDEASAPQPPKKRRRRSTKVVNPEEDQKREEFLARNREAASKSRQKKKEWTKSLEETMRNLTAENSHLKYTVSCLKEEIINMKTLCLAHVDCNCVGVREYMNRALEGQVTQSGCRQSLLPTQQSISRGVPAASQAADGFQRRPSSVSSPTDLSENHSSARDTHSPQMAGAQRDGIEAGTSSSSVTPQVRQTASPSMPYEDFEDRKISLADVLLDDRDDEMMWNDTCGDDYITGGVSS